MPLGGFVSDRGFMSWWAALPIGMAWIRGGGCAARRGKSMNSRYGDLEFSFFLSFWIACSLFGARRDCGFFLCVSWAVGRLWQLSLGAGST